jgi:hypothetical protein
LSAHFIWGGVIALMNSWWVGSMTLASGGES